MPRRVVEAPEVVGRLGPFWVGGLGGVEHAHVFQAVGEAAIAVGLLGLLVEGEGRALAGGAPVLEISQVIGCHGRFPQGFCHGGDGEHLRGLVPKPRLCVVEGQFVVVAHGPVHHFHHFLEHVLVFCQEVFFVDDAVVEAVEQERLPDELQALVQLFRSPHLQRALLAGLLPEPEHGGFQCPRLVVATVENEASVELVEGVVVAVLRRADAGRLEVAGVGPRLVPRAFPEQVVSLLPAVLVFQGECEVEDGLAVVGVGISLFEYSHGLSQESLGPLEAPSPEEPEPRLVEAPDVVGVAAERLLVVVEGRPGGVAVLLQVESGEEELVVGLRVLGRKGGLGGVGDGAYLVVLGRPGHQRRALCVGPCDDENQVFHVCALHVDGLLKYLLG